MVFFDNKQLSICVNRFNLVAKGNYSLDQYNLVKKQQAEKQNQYVFIYLI